MNLKNFTDQQQHALLDLAVMAMYADGHLAAAEEERVARLLDSMGFVSEYDRAQQYDAAVSRVRSHMESADSARNHAVKLATLFSNAEQRRQVHTMLHDLVASDSSVTPQESTFLSAVRQALQI